MPKWSYSENRDSGGSFIVVFHVPGKATYDATYFRDVPVIVENYASGDPFGDATATLRFPQITGFDELEGGVVPWLDAQANVDIYYAEAETGPSPEIIDSITQDKTIEWAGSTWDRVFEGIVASFDIRGTGSDNSLVVQLQGALFQLDRYVQKPFFPPRPYVHEALLREVFDPSRKPHLRTKAMKTTFPAGWTKKAKATSESVFDPIGATPGTNVTGYSTRGTGAFERVLTGFAQELLSVMYVDEDCGIVPGSKWTVLKDVDRQPHLQVRDRYAAANFSINFGTPGVEVRLTHEIVSAINTIYGEGTAVDGTQWSNTSMTPDGERTEYIPLAYDGEVWPASGNPNLNRNKIAQETFVKFGSNFGLDQAYNTAAQMLAQDNEPGWAGNIDLKVDLPGVSRWKIKAGQNLLLRNFAGYGESGILLHIAEVVANPTSGSLSMKVDSKFRDLLTLEEVQSRTRDPLTPSKILQVGKRSITIEDTLAPWNYDAGSGMIGGTNTKKFWSNIAATDHFPWTAQAKKYPPGLYPDRYIRVRANAASPNDRWGLTSAGVAYPVIMAERGTIRLTQVAAFDYYGNPAACKFHMSIYYTPVGLSNMPFNGSTYSAFHEGAFHETDENGYPWGPNTFLGPDEHLKIGWGDGEQGAGYWPGRESDGYPKTGRLVDEGTWNFDTSENPDFVQNPMPGQTQKVNSYTMYVMFYAEHSTDVYFIGRLYRQEPGT